jgi:hypothetical protein
MSLESGNRAGAVRPERRNVLPFPEPLVGPDDLRSASSVVNAAFDYQTAVAGHLKEHESDAAGLTFEDALGRVSRIISPDRVASVSQTAWGARYTAERGNGLLTRLTAHAVTMYPERFEPVSPSTEVSQSIDVDGTPISEIDLPKVTRDAPQGFRK